MIRRIPSDRLPFAFVFLFAVVVGCVQPCAAVDDEQPGQVVDRSGLQLDDMKPGDDDQPTIGGRHGSQNGDLSVPNVTSQPIQPSEPAPTRRVGVLQSWIRAVREFVARIETLR